MQQTAVDRVALAEVLPTHSVEVAAIHTLKFLSSEVLVDGVVAVRRLPGDVVDDIEHVVVAPAARVKSLPVRLAVSTVFDVVVYTRYESRLYRR